MRDPDARILIFAKPPVPGQSKTRLIPVLGEQGAAQLQARLVERTLTTATQAKLAPVELWCANNREHPFFKQCQDAFSVALKQQQGGDLGERMANAFAATLKQAKRAILIGSDCPALSAADLEAALVALKDGHDCVLKPAEDGGYVLIGLSLADHAVFEDIHWGSATVMTETRARLQSLEWRWHELATTWDVDRPVDLERLENSGLDLIPTYK
jgi:rSAM/selenodomain-associated transferase 1